MKNRSKALKSKRGIPPLKGGGNPERPTRIVESARTTNRERRKQHPEIVTSQTILPPIRVAAYVRTARQQPHLASNQVDAIRDYAKRHGMQIVKEYSVTGRLKTGHSWALQNRPLQGALFISENLIQARVFLISSYLLPQPPQMPLRTGQYPEIICAGHLWVV